MYTTIDDVYQAYVERAGTDEIATRDEFARAIFDIRPRYEAIDDETFWDTLPAWLWGEEPKPGTETVDAR